QDRIAAVICSIADLIDVNRRRVQRLEELGRLVYRDWFVRYRYPGHQESLMVDSPLGPIPRGWEAAVTGDLMKEGLIDIGDGYRAKNSEMTDDETGMPFVRIGNVRDGFLDLSDADRLPDSYRTRLKSKVSQSGDTVISMKGTIG